jgi:hypothetical protein
MSAGLAGAELEPSPLINAFQDTYLSQVIIKRDGNTLTARVRNPSTRGITEAGSVTFQPQIEQSGSFRDGVDRSRGSAEQRIR